MANGIVVSDINERLSMVRTLIRPLRPERNGHPVDAQGQIVFTREGNGRKAVVTIKDTGSGLSYRDWFFRTSANLIRAQYFEIWISNESESEWQLCQACLHLFLVQSHDDPLEEILAIHCEPSLLATSDKLRFKRGPHVHLKAAKHPIGKAHFPLNLGHLEEVLSTIDNLGKALSDAVHIAQLEVIQAEW